MVLMAELDPRPTVMRRLCRVRRIWLQCFHKLPFLLLGDRKQIPRPWSAGRLQLPVRPRPFASSFRGSSPTSAPTENPPLPSRPSEKMVAPVCPRYFCCGIRTVLIRQIPVWKICSTETPVVAASWSPPQCYLRFEAVTSNSLCLTM